MDFSIQNSFRTQALTPPNGDGRPGANLVDMDPTAIVEQFARMLVAQLSNQDPDNAMDPTEIVSQYAQMTASLGLAKLTNTQAFYEQVRVAASTVGKVVSYEGLIRIDEGGPDDQPQWASGEITGTVTTVDFSSAYPTIYVDGEGPIPITDVLRIWN